MVGGILVSIFYFMVFAFITDIIYINNRGIVAWIGWLVFIYFWQKNN